MFTVFPYNSGIKKYFQINIIFLIVQGKLGFWEDGLSYLRYLYFGVASNAYGQANVLSAYIFLAPAIVAGVVTLGVMQQIIRAFGRVESSMQYLLRAWPTIIELLSVYKRLREFEKMIEIKIEKDKILEIGLTPNRSDAMSHYGVARDLKAFLDLNNEKASLKQPSIGEFTYDDFKIETKIKIKPTIKNVGIVNCSDINILIFSKETDPTSP